MNVGQCCQIETRAEDNVCRPASRLPRGREVAGWIIPGAILALLPKCPLCLAGYAAVWTGIGLSFSAVTHLRAVIMILCVGVILFLTAKNTGRLVYKFGKREKIIVGRAIC